MGHTAPIARGSEVMVPLCGLCRVLDIRGAAADLLYVLQAEAEEPIIQIPVRGAAEVGVRLLLSRERMWAALVSPLQLPCPYGESPAARFGRFLAILQSGRPTARREVLTEMNRLPRLEPYEVNLRRRIRRNFRLELQRTLCLTEYEAAQLVRDTTQ
jgi:RNA polymerase-interacting CarD/CdnL/TRCF family regulator